jgi:hypothetical protein
MSLELADLFIMAQIIRECQSRGAFKAEEMIPIGILYKKIIEILSNKKNENTVVEIRGG